MQSSASTVVCRMMNSAACAYDINTTTGKFSTSQPYYNAVGYRSLPVAITGGSDKINGVLIGTTGDGVVIACRGTLAPAANLPSILDWIQDIFFSTPIAVDGLPGKVHSGFYMAINSIWEPLLHVVRQQLNAAGPETKLYVTGHSKGGGMASILAMMLKNEPDIPTPQVYTYASPKPGNFDFAQDYNAAIKQTTYENYLDLVPFLPPADPTIRLFAKIPLLGDLFKDAEGWDYSPVGRRYYIEKNGEAILVTPYLNDVRAGEIIFNIVEDNIKAIVDAHCHLCRSTGCAGGYMQGACGGEVCGS